MAISNPLLASSDSDPLTDPRASRSVGRRGPRARQGPVMEGIIGRPGGAPRSGAADELDLDEAGQRRREAGEPVVEGGRGTERPTRQE